MDKAGKAELARKETNRAEREAIACAKPRQERICFERKAIKFRVFVFGMEGKLARSMVARHVLTKRQTAEKQSALCEGCEAVDGVTFAAVGIEIQIVCMFFVVVNILAVQIRGVSELATCSSFSSLAFQSLRLTEFRNFLGRNCSVILQNSVSKCLAHIFQTRFTPSQL